MPANYCALVRDAITSLAIGVAICISFWAPTEQIMRRHGGVKPIRTRKSNRSNPRQRRLRPCAGKVPGSRVFRLFRMSPAGGIGGEGHSAKRHGSEGAT